jgi:hypothetical protein
MSNGRVMIWLVAAGVALLWSPGFAWAQSEASFAAGQGSYLSVVAGNSLLEVDTVSTDTIVGSGNGGTGIINVNQASGSMNDQANLRAIALSLDSPDATGTTAISLGGGAVLGDNQIDSTRALRSDVIDSSFQNSVGIIGVNQSSGNMNTQRNVLALALGGGAATLTEGELADLRAPNSLTQEGGSRIDTITNSFSNTQGIVQVTQSAGDLNVLGNNLAISLREVILR